MQNDLLIFNTISDERGCLVSLEENRNIPFDIKRVYYIYGTDKSQPRGFHAHKKLQQVLICVSGSCKVLLDDGREKKVYTLKNPNEGLFIDKMIWREMYDFTDDCVLMVIASEYYDESDYIRDYSKFISEIK